MIPSPLPVPSGHKTRRPVHSDDLRLFSAITGRSAKIADAAEDIPIQTQSGVPHTIGAIARRVLTPDVSHLTLRLREIWELGIANGLKRQQISDWVRHVSDEAFKRLEEAQERLSDTRRRQRTETRHIAIPPTSETKWQNVA